MAVQKQSSPSFALITSVLSIVFYCVGFLRLEVELNEQKNRINALESVVNAIPPSDPPDNQNIKLPKSSPGESEFQPVSGQIQAKCFNSHDLF